MPAGVTAGLGAACARRGVTLPRRVCHRVYIARALYARGSASIDFNQRGSVAKAAGLRSNCPAGRRAKRPRRVASGDPRPLNYSPRLKRNHALANTVIKRAHPRARHVHLNGRDTDAKKERLINDRSPRHVRCESSPLPWIDALGSIYPASFLSRPRL